jgi:hypothetical protein
LSGTPISRTRFTGPAHLEQIITTQIELFQQKRRHVLRAVVGHFQAHRVAVMAMRQFALQLLTQVLVFLVIDKQVGVARDPELVAATGFHTGEQLADMRMQDRRQEHETELTAGDLRRQLDHSRQRARRLHHGAIRVAAEGVLTGQLHSEVQTFVEHIRGTGGPDRVRSASAPASAR